MALFSYHGGVPAPLPSALVGAELDRLVKLGYSGPFPFPSFNPRTQTAKWTGEQWEINDLSPEEIQLAEQKRLLSRANWDGFTEALMTGSAYTKARTAAATSLQANVDCTELIAFLADARAGRPHIEKINACFASIDAEVDLTEEDKAELYGAVQDNGLGAFLIIPNYEPPSDDLEGDDE